MTDKAFIIKAICDSLMAGDVSHASEIAQRQYPFKHHSLEVRKFTDSQALYIFMRDGFIDRYSGTRLLFPAVLRVLSLSLSPDFPFHRNWKMNETHQSYWELFPTLDHVVPIARGGADIGDNLVSTSMLRNSTKSNWTLEELGWSLYPPGNMAAWDGMLAWFIAYVDKNRPILKDNYIGRWYKIAVAQRR